MKNNKTILTSVFALCLYSVFLLTGCMGDYELPTVETKEANTYLVSLKLPDDFSLATRAMEKTFESAIDKDKLLFLVFKEDGAQEKFAYIAPVKGEPEIIDGKVQYQLSLVANGKNDNAKSRIVIIANYTPSITLTKGMEKEDLYKTLVFDSPEEWATNLHIPMWGELKQSFKIEENMAVGAEKEIEMLRSMAKIDIALNYTNSADQTSEAVSGVVDNNFKLKSARFYRSSNKGAVVPFITNLDNTGTAVNPTIPAGASSRAFTNPLVYEAAAADGNSMIREIYVSEISDFKEGNTTEFLTGHDRHCLVIGGFYEGSTTETFYRVNFDESENKALHHILRNHQYRVNIQKVIGKGHSTPDEAFNSVRSNIKSSVAVWEDKIIDMHVNGIYKFGVSAREIEFDYKPGEKQQIIFSAVNLGADVKEKIKIFVGASTTALDLSSGTANIDEFFKITGFGENGMSIETIKENNGELHTKDLKIKVGEDVFEFDLKLKQLALSDFFEFDCPSVKTTGVIKSGEALGDNHTINIWLKALPGTVLTNKVDIELSTNEVDGVKYSGSCTFEPGMSVVHATLKGSGTSDVIKTKHFMVRATNIKSTASCHVAIRTALKKKVILTTSAGEVSWLLTEGGNAGKALKNSNNFGATDHSIVPIEDLEIINCSTGSLEAEISSKPPNVIITTFSTNLSVGARKALEKFVRNGGVLIYLQQDGAPPVSTPFAGLNENFKFISRLLDDNVKTMSDEGGLTLEGTNDGLWNGAHLIEPNFNDAIMNGPFGDVRGRYWGQDQGHTSKLKFTEEQKNKLIMEYSTGSVVARNRGTVAGVLQKPEYTTMFRMRKFNVFWVGDSGFVGASGDTEEYHAGWSAYPFGWKPDPNNEGFNLAIPKPDRLPGNAKSPDLYNSILFMNAVTWAVDAAQHGWNKYDEDGNPVDTPNALPNPDH